MSDQLINFIQRLKTNKNLLTYDEASTKQTIVLPILNMLGWNTFERDEVFPEYAAENRRVDYCLRSIDPKVFIEVKRPSEDLERHQKQLLEYAFSEGVSLAILTNGVSWSFYLPLKGGNWQNRLFYTIDIVLQDSREANSRFSDFLSKQNVVSETALKNAEAILAGKRNEEIIEETIPEAWNKIISEIDPLLVDLIAELTERLCGRKPTNDKVKTFLERYGDSFLLLPEDEKEELESQSSITLPSQKKSHAQPIHDDKKISQDDLIPHILNILKNHGGRAEKKQVETEIYQMFKPTFDLPWYQELVSWGVPRWKHNIAWAKERAKRRGLIKMPSDSGRGIWEIDDSEK